jgi:hypothetical protein
LTTDRVEAVQTFFQTYVFGFIFRDIETAINGRANYLAALGLVAYTEFMGGLIDGTLGQTGKSKQRFYSFWRRMGPPYQSLQTQRALVKIYSHVRSGLVHSYFISQASIVKMSIGDGHGENCGLEVIEPGGKVMFIVERYFADFKAACQSYYEELVVTKDEPQLRAFEQAVAGQWFTQGTIVDP